MSISGTNKNTCFICGDPLGKYYDLNRKDLAIICCKCFDIIVYQLVICHIHDELISSIDCRDCCLKCDTCGNDPCIKGLLLKKIDNLGLLRLSENIRSRIEASRINMGEPSG